MRALLIAGIMAGVLASLAVTAIQLLEAVPLIHAAEQAQGGHDSAAASAGIARRLGTLGANLLAGIGYGLLVAAGLALMRHSGWRRGLLWGLAGFAAFSLAPAQGLPPELPGAEAADLGLRQAW